MSAGSANSPSVLLVRLDAIGDALTLVPAIEALRHHGFRVGAVLRPVNAAIFSGRALDSVHVAGQLDSLVEDIRSQHYGAALIATEKPEGYRLARRARIPARVGFENGWGKPLKTLWIRRMCTHTIFRTAGLDSRAPHECQVVFALARTLVAEPEPSRDPLILRRYVIDEEPEPDPRIAFQVTGKWQRLGASLEALAELATRIATRRDIRFIAAEQEAPYASAFSQRTGRSIETFASLAPWKNAIAAARAIVAPDSGAAHIAGMVGTPVVSCFAREEFSLQSKRWAPWAAPHRVLPMEGPWPIVAADALEELLSGSPQFSYTG